MQSVDRQLDVAVELLKATLEYMSEYIIYQGFLKALLRHLITILKWNFLSKRVSKRCRLSLHETSDEPILDPIDLFRFEYFNVMVHEAIAQLNEKFKQMVQLRDKYGFIFDINSIVKISVGNNKKGSKASFLHLEGDRSCRTDDWNQ